MVDFVSLCTFVNMKIVRIALFASGTGSNAKNIINYFENHAFIKPELVLSNKTDAGIVAWCKSTNFPVYVFDNEQVANGDFLVDFCKNHQIDVIVLAGYLRKIPVELIHAYADKMLNVHPSLLPKYGGKGMYGSKVHAAVLAHNESTTGITIHFVNEHFDEGRYVAQFTTSIADVTTIEAVETKIHQLEQAYFPVVIEKTIEHEMIF